MDDGWQWGEVSDGGQRGIKYDARVISTMEQGALVVCDTFVEFAPLLAQARNMRDALADVARWLDSVGSFDMEEIVADGGVTAGMIVGQEARFQAAKVHSAIAKAKGANQ